MYERITSIKHEVVKTARNLQTASGRLASGACLVYGTEAVGWALDSEVPMESVFVTTPEAAGDDLAARLTQAGAGLYLVSEGISKKITGTNYVTDVVAVAYTGKARKAPGGGDFMLLLDDVVDQGNIGTIIRTAAGFGVDDIGLVGRSRNVFGRKTVDASRGTVFSARMKHYETPEDAVRSLKNEGCLIVATSPYGNAPQSLVNLEPSPLALIVGNETDGVSGVFLDQADYLVRIPMTGAVESLNVGVAAGISVYELKLKQVMAMLISNIRATFGRELNVTAMLMRRVFDAFLKQKTGMDGAQVILMMVMKCDSVMTRGQIERDMASHGSELDTMLAVLLDRGYVRMSPDGEEEQYSLTDAGTSFLASIWNDVNAAEEAVLDCLSRDERVQFNACLARIRERCVSLLDSPK